MRRLFPFLAWFPLNRAALKADLLAGLAVALVLVPQSMAYAQLAGMPAVYGLYASLLPVAVGALWGSSQQLATGPVAMVSLLTGFALAQFAPPGSPQFVAYAILLALMVGVLQLALGLARLGAVVNFLSHPVIVGFTNAAALIIALSQVNKLLGVPIDRSKHFLADVAEMLAQAGQTHWPTLGIGCGALAVILLCRRYAPRAPGMLIAVALATLVSWASGFERNASAGADEFADATVRQLVEEAGRVQGRIAEWQARIAVARESLLALQGESAEAQERRLAHRFEIDAMGARIQEAQLENRDRLRTLRKLALARASGGDRRYHAFGASAPGVELDGGLWRVTGIQGDVVQLRGGGEVVGAIPVGIPELRLPQARWDAVLALLPVALVITLVGFMEAVSIGKAMATRTRQRLDANQELIGQGLANIAGCVSQSFPVSGSFSRSAVNLNAGAATGLSSVVSALIVLVTLLAFTPLLYHLPQAVLAAIIIVAVSGLLNFRAMRHAWQAQRQDGIASVITFAATLLLAPQLDLGILFGGGLAVVLYLYRTMRPRVALLARHGDGTLRDAAVHQLPLSRRVIVLRFDGELYFANVPYFEDAVLEAVAQRPEAKHVLIVGDGINQMDASGEEVVRHLVERLRENGVSVAFCGLKLQVLEVMRKTGLYGLIGEANFHRTEQAALQAILAGEPDPALSPR